MILKVNLSIINFETGFSPNTLSLKVGPTFYELILACSFAVFNIAQCKGNVPMPWHKFGHNWSSFRASK
jgi:hypothetical protein